VAQLIGRGRWRLSKRVSRAEGAGEKSRLAFAEAAGSLSRDATDEDYLHMGPATESPEILRQLMLNYDGLMNDISAGDTVLVDDGVIQMLVLEKQKDRIRCKVATLQAKCARLPQLRALPHQDPLLPRPTGDAYPQAKSD
jgi:hypothetical protein